MNQIKYCMDENQEKIERWSNMAPESLLRID